MAKVTSFMLCDTINNVPMPTGEMIQQLMLPQSVLRPQFVPGNFSFGIAVGVQDMDLHKTNQVRFTISDPQGNVIQDSGMSEFPPVPGVEEETLPKEYQGFLLNMDIRNLVVQQNGAYMFSIFLNGERIGNQVIPIFQKDTNK